MGIDKKLNSRKAVLLRPDGLTENIKPENIKAGMNVYLFESNGAKIEYDGIRLFHVTKDAWVNNDGVVVFEYIPFG